MTINFIKDGDFISSNENDVAAGREWWQIDYVIGGPDAAFSDNWRLTEGQVKIIQPNYWTINDYNTAKLSAPLSGGAVNLHGSIGGTITQKMTLSQGKYNIVFYSSRNPFGSCAVHAGDVRVSLRKDGGDPKSFTFTDVAGNQWVKRSALFDVVEDGDYYLSLMNINPDGIDLVCGSFVSNVSMTLVTER